MRKVLVILSIILAVVVFYPPSASDSGTNPIRKATQEIAGATPSMVNDVGAQDIQRSPVNEVRSTQISVQAIYLVTVVTHGDSHPSFEGLDVAAIVNDKKHLAQLNSENMATFYFDDKDLVEYVMFAPPSESKYGGQQLSQYKRVGLDKVTSATLNLYPAATISGRILDINMRPLPGIEVNVYGWYRHTYPHTREYRPLITTLTDDSGHYTFHNAPAGSRHILANHQQWVTVNPKYINSVFDRPAPITVSCNESLVLADHQVLPLYPLIIDTKDARGKAMPNVSVAVTPIALSDAALEAPEITEGLFDDDLALAAWQQDSATAPNNELRVSNRTIFLTTDSEGKVNVNVLRGNYKVNLPAYPGNSIDLKVPCAPATIDADVEQAEVRFMVVDENGQPIPKAEVVFSSDDLFGIKTHSNDQGEVIFNLQSLQSDISFSVKHLDFKTQLYNFETAKEIPDELILLRGSSFFGTLVDSAGEAIEDNPEYNLIVNFADGSRAMAKITDGTFNFSGVPNGIHQVSFMTYSGTNWEGKIINSFTLNSEESPHRLVIDAAAMEKSYSYWGKVIDASTKAPINSASVTFRNGKYSLTMNSDDNGKFDIRQESLYDKISVSQIGYLPQTITLDSQFVSSEKQPLIIELGRGGRPADLQLIGSSGTFYPYGAIKITEIDGATIPAGVGLGRQNVMVLEDGHLRLDHIVPGQYLLKFFATWGFGTPTDSCIFTIPSGQGLYRGLVQMNKSHGEIRDLLLTEHLGEQGYTD
ncbi:MAG: hypothetical protein H8E25_02835 [Planctomycetes bacterium]|nr:hypothetical protein [Planctomycetota bacterium]